MIPFKEEVTSEEAITLAGLDVGSTTCRVAVARARVVAAGAGGPLEIGDVREDFRADPVRTPFRGEALDEAALLGLIDGWLAAAGVRAGGVFGGGALLTGLAARAPNAPAIVAALRERLGGALVTTAGDPHLEAWLSFHGNAGALSRGDPSRRLLNLDIGGGTTNLALGRGGEVTATGWLWVGARHVEVEPGTYRLAGCSTEAQETMAHLGIARSPGEELLAGEVEALLDVWVDHLEAAVTGCAPRWPGPLVAAPLRMESGAGEAGSGIELTYSGGVGGLFYDVLAGRPLPPLTHYGDLGIDLARRMARSEVLTSRAAIPESMGRATVYGLLRYQTHISGSTIYLPRGEALPEGDLPILGSIASEPDPVEIRRLVTLARASAPAGCIVVRGGLRGSERVRALGTALGEVLREGPGGAPVVILMRENSARALGGYATEWGRAPQRLAVLDEIAVEESTGMAPGGAHLVRVGAPRAGFVPLSFHCMA